MTLQRTGFALVATISLALATSSPSSADLNNYPKSPTGMKTPMDQEGRNSLNDAMVQCRSEMVDHKNPADARDRTYLAYIINRAWAEKKNPGSTKFDGKILDSVPAQWIPKCDKYFDDYAKGVGAADLPLSQSCGTFYLHVTDQKIADFMKQRRTNPQEARIISARKALEAARRQLFSRWEGMGGHCTAQDHFKKAFKPLNSDFLRMERLIVEAEKNKGVRALPPPPDPQLPFDPRGMYPSKVWNDYVYIKSGQRVTNPSEF